MVRGLSAFAVVPRRYLRKESLWPYLDQLVDRALLFLREQKRLPALSCPMRVIKTGLQPKAARCRATLKGAPPKTSPSGNRSTRISPNKSTAWRATAIVCPLKKVYVRSGKKETDMRGDKLMIDLS